MTDLHACVSDGNIDEIRKSLQDPNCNVNAKNGHGETALVLADYESPEILQMLVDAGAEVNVSDRYGQTPLHLAVESASYKSVRLLITAGAKVDAENSFRKTPLQLAVKYGIIKIVKKLVQSGADARRPLVVHKVEHEPLLSYLESINATISIAPERVMSSLALVKSMSGHAFWHCITYPERGVNSYDAEGFCYLHLAVFRGNLPHVQYLIETAGADLHRQTANAFGQTPLHIAAALSTAVDNYDVVKYLLDKGADVSAVDSKGNTPLHVLCARGRAINNGEIARLLVDSGASIAARSKDGKTPLHSAMAWDSLRNPCEVVQLLLERGADLHTPDKAGISAFDYALRRQGQSVVRLLLNHCGDAVRSRTSEGRTTLHMATENQNAEVLRCLLDLGIDVNAKTSLGYTALHYAVKYGNDAACEVLIRNGADIECLSCNGTSPLLGAVATGDVTTFELLLDFGADLYGPGVGESSCFSTALTHGTEQIRLAAVQYGVIYTFRGKPIPESDMRCIHASMELVYHWGHCEMELKRMEQWKFYDKGVSLLDLLTVDHKVLENYAKDQKLVASFNFTRDGVYWDLHNFPIYYPILCDRLDAELSYWKQL